VHPRDREAGDRGRALAVAHGTAGGAAGTAAGDEGATRSAIFDVSASTSSVKSSRTVGPRLTP
jgi:hypothetical protein